MTRGLLVELDALDQTAMACDVCGAVPELPPWWSTLQRHAEEDPPAWFEHPPCPQGWRVISQNEALEEGQPFPALRVNIICPRHRPDANPIANQLQEDVTSHGLASTMARLIADPVRSALYLRERVGPKEGESPADHARRLMRIVFQLYFGSAARLLAAGAIVGVLVTGLCFWLVGRPR